jgi:L-histidine N-alpha-methyltransferase
METSCLQMTDCLETTHSGELASDVARGLAAAPRSIPSRYLYDERGSNLFKQICRLPEYYLTRTELSLLRQAAPLILRGREETDLVELGAGSNLKIRAILDSLAPARRRDLRYIPLDVCKEVLRESGEELRHIYPEVPFVGVVGDFNRHLPAIPDGRPRVFLFLGSTLGNFEEDEAHELLTAVAESMRPGDSFVLGLDRVKPTPLLEGAYNDGQGVTAAFNRNVLAVVNRELHADFDLDAFGHLAFYRPDKSRVEMHLQTLEDTSVRVEDLDLGLELRQGETIRTEVCRKFDAAEMERMSSAAGLSITNCFTDPGGMFSLLELERTLPFSS